MADFLFDEGKNKIEGLNKEAINTALNSKADAQAVANAFQSVNTALDGKASTQALNTAVQDINTALNGKASTEALNEAVQSINTALQSKANTTDVLNVKNEVDFMFEENADVKTSPFFVKYPEYSANVYNGNNVRLEPNSNYDSYFLILPKSATIYFGATVPAYTSICYGVPPCEKETDKLRWGCTSATRYRNLDNNLPVENTPLNVLKNGLIIITVTKNETVSIYGLDLSFEFTETAKKQIIETVNFKKPIIKKGAAAGYVSERLYIYLPAKVGFVEFDFAHYINASINADTWNIRMTNAVDEELNNRFLLTTTGEFECAIKIDGAPDFMGGISHGSEIITDVQILLDGKPINLSELSENVTFEELRIVTISNLYNPSDEITIVAEHSKEYIFDNQGLTINQMIKWLNSHTLTDSYLAMFPTAKTIINKLRVNNKIETFNLAQTMPSIASGVKHAYSWGDAITCDFDISDWNIEAQNASGEGSYFISDNGGQNYYKQYYKALAAGTVQNGNVWLTSSHYKIQIGN